MLLTDAPVTRQTLSLTLEERHRFAAGQHEMAVKHHKLAALLHASGDARQADTHANLAHNNALSALAIGKLALKA